MSERIVVLIVASSATDHGGIVEVVPSYFVEQIVAGATDHGGNCGGVSVVRRGADRGIVPQIMEEIVDFLREVPQVQFVGCGVPVITQRRFDSEGASNSVRRQSLWAFSWSAEGGTSLGIWRRWRGFSLAFHAFFALLQVV